MKLAMLAPIAWRTPPEHYGPWESIASLLTEGLVARGVDVTLFATLDSVTAAALDGVCPHGYAEDAQLDGRVWEALHVSYALARSGEFELVHNHLDWLPLAFGEQLVGIGEALREPVDELLRLHAPDLAAVPVVEELVREEAVDAERAARLAQLRVRKPRFYRAIL